MKDFCGQVGAKLDICAILFAVLCICSWLIAPYFFSWDVAATHVLTRFIGYCIAYSIFIPFLFMLINVAIITPIRGVVCLFSFLKEPRFSKAGTILFASAFSLQILACYIVIATLARY
jgi:hypothetical protein